MNNKDSPFARLREVADARKAELNRKGITIAAPPTPLAAMPETTSATDPGSGTTVVAGYHQPVTTVTTDSRGTTATSEAGNEGPLVVGSSQKDAWARPNLTQVNLKIPRAEAEKFRLWCFENRISLNQVFVIAWQRFLDTGGLCGTTDTTSRQGTTGSTYLIDDKIDEDIINLYTKLTSRTFTQQDRQTLLEVKTQFDPAYIRIGILLSVTRAKRPINSLRYCVGAMSEAAELPASQAQQYLAYIGRKLGLKP